MIEKAEDGDGDLLGHLMLTARKVAKEQGLEKVKYQVMDFSCALHHNEPFKFRATEWSSTMELRGASRSTTCTSTSLEAGSSTGPLAKACLLVNLTFFGESTFHTNTIPWLNSHICYPETLSSNFIPFHASDFLIAITAM